MKKIIITIDGEDEAWLHIYAKSMKMNCKEAAKRLLLREIQTMKEWSTSFVSPIKQTTIHSARIKSGQKNTNGT